MSELTGFRHLFGVVPIPNLLWHWLLWGAAAAFAVWPAMQNAYRIRTFAITEFGKVIHEFDPWFNFRATQYLSKMGWYEFFHWFDHMSWYPLGRPVGTTIYPGLQITAVAIHRALRWLGDGYKQTLNHVCCFLPCWGGACATMFVFLLTYEATGSITSGAIAAAVMAIIPAHTMRSVGGGFDNESIGMTAIVMTFYFWIRSIRTEKSWPFGILTGLAYGYMVAAWGGFIITLNIVTAHAALLALFDFLRGTYNEGIYRAFTLFFVIGTFIATRVPVVSYNPFRSLEQLSAFVLFCILQGRHYTELKRRREGVASWSARGLMLRVAGPLAAVFAMAAVAMVLWPTGYFGPLSARVRGLFLKHTRTGNPLVDSVAEHQPASADAYRHYLHSAYDAGWWGLYFLPVLAILNNRIRGASFLATYCAIVYYFSVKMARLMLLTAPGASALVGALLGGVIDICVAQAFWSPKAPIVVDDVQAEKPAEQAEQGDYKKDDGDEKKSPKGKGKKEGGKKSGATAKDEEKAADWSALVQKGERVKATFDVFWHQIRLVRLLAAIAVLYYASGHWQKPWKEFAQHSEQLAHGMSNPQLMFKTRLSNGQEVIIDDYREAYHWLRDKTPKDARVMAWWDYGYQITGIGERTSIADGNTWNHEHIATLGYMLTSPTARAHKYIRHVADYVLVWAGGGGDDLAKSPHMARIGNSVYRDICPNDPTCSHFGFRSQGYNDPTPMMRDSLLYNIITAPGGMARGNGKVDNKLFKEAYQSKYGLVRIWKVMNVSQESKDWLADKNNWKCDAPGSWYCEGQYPTETSSAWKKLLARRRDFGQLEDFNRKKRDDKYHREYMRRMGSGED